MKYITRYLNYPKKIRLFFKIELQKQYEMDLYNLFTFTSLVNQKIHYTLWKKKKKQMNSYATRQLYRSFSKIGIYLFGIYLQNFHRSENISQCLITRNRKSFFSYELIVRWTRLTASISTVKLRNLVRVLHLWSKCTNRLQGSRDDGQRQESTAPDIIVSLLRK